MQSTLLTDMKYLKEKSPMKRGDMSMLEKAIRTLRTTSGPIDSFMRSMRISEQEFDKEAAGVMREIEESLKPDHQ